jgi:hypothetical protein
MSTDGPINLKQDRRQWLKTSAAALGASLVPMPALAEVTGSKTAPTTRGESSSSATVFTPAQYTLVEELAEAIIPADSQSGGAKAAKVAAYIEQILRESADDNRKAVWREGLRLVDLMSQHYNGKRLIDANSEERIAVLTVLSDNDSATDLPEIRFFRDLKELTIRGYYTSKIGIHDELEYKGNRVLTEYVGCDDPVPGER